MKTSENRFNSHLKYKILFILQINNKRTSVNLYMDIVLVTRRTHFLYDIVYQQQHRSCDSNAYLSDGSHKNLLSCTFA